MKIRSHPHLLQINASFLVSRLPAKKLRKKTLLSVPDEDWRLIRKKGFDLVWLMGVWRRSPGSRKAAAGEPSLRRAYDIALPGWSEKDVGGSPYAIHDYALDPYLGDVRTLPQLKKRLNALGLGLILDFVPNHLAFDHPWTLKKPEYLLRGSDRAVREHPEWFFKTSRGRRFAHGRDPYFAPWSDTVQVDIFSQKAREALIGELLKVASFCDGVRCDMAMLLLDEVFGRVWGGHRASPKDTQGEFWAEAAGKLRSRYPGFILMAEVYWGLEGRLQQLGFDYTYDKEFYDRLLGSGAPEIRQLLGADPSFLSRMARFLENHDEERALTAFGPQKSCAAAAVISTLPGLRFFQDGQAEGRKLRTPIHLRREAPAGTAEDVADFYRRLWVFADDPVMHEGRWSLLEPRPAWEGNESHRHFLAWFWQAGRKCRVIAVNYSPHTSQCRLILPGEWPGAGKRPWLDHSNDRIFEKDTAQLRSEGLYAELDPWKAHLFEFER